MVLDPELGVPWKTQPSCVNESSSFWMTQRCTMGLRLLLSSTDTANILACYKVNQSLLEHLIFSLRDQSHKTRNINFITMVHLFSCPQCQRPQGKFFRKKNFSTCAPPKTFWFTDSMFPNYCKSGHFLKRGICVSLRRVKRKRNKSVVLFISKEHVYC